MPLSKRISFFIQFERGVRAIPYAEQVVPLALIRRAIDYFYQTVAVVRNPARRQTILNSVKEAIAAPMFLSAAGQMAWRAYLRSQNSYPRRPKRVAIVAHVYYPDLLDEIVACWRACPPGTPLHITTQPRNESEVQKQLAATPGVILHLHDNRGRDIAPFMAVLNSGALANFDAVLKLHTKRSPHLPDGETRRRLLFAGLAGNHWQVNRILSKFDNQTTGIVGWSKSYRNRSFYWMANKPHVMHLCRDMQPTTDIAVSFFEGSMFWFRPAALEPLRSLHLATEDFEPEEGQTDGALHHAIERVFNLSAVAAGYNVVSDTGQTLIAAKADHLQ